MAKGLLPGLPELCWQLVTGIVLMQLFRDLLHLSVAQIAILFLHYLLFGEGELKGDMDASESGAEAGGKQNNGPTWYSVYSRTGNPDAPLLRVK